MNTKLTWVTHWKSYVHPWLWWLQIKHLHTRTRTNLNLLRHPLSNGAWTFDISMGMNYNLLKVVSRKMKNFFLKYFICCKWNAENMWRATLLCRLEDFGGWTTGRPRLPAEILTPRYLPQPVLLVYEWSLFTGDQLLCMAAYHLSVNRWMWFVVLKL